MDQILTTAALILGGTFAVWILFSDTLGEEGKGGQMDTTLLFAFLMIPLIIAVLIGIVLFLPILLGIILVLFIAYGAYLGIKWLLTRERQEREEGKEGKEGEEGRLHKMFRNIRKSFSSIWNSQASRTVRERTKETIVTLRKSAKEKGSKLKTRVSERIREVREKKPKRVRETTSKLRVADRHRDDASTSSRRDSARSDAKSIRSDSRSYASVQTVREEERTSQGRSSNETRSRNSDQHGDTQDKKTLQGRLQRWRNGLRQNWQKSGTRPGVEQNDVLTKKDSNARAKKVRGSEHGHAHDPLTNMRRIGWSTRRHLGEVYHHRKKSR